MKKQFLILVMSVFATVAFANGPVDFGLNLKYSMPRSEFKEVGVSGLGDVLRDSENGYSGGLFLRFNKNRLFFQGEAMFSFKTSTFKENQSSKLIENIMKTKTLDVPVFVGVNIVNGKIFKLKAFTGPTFSWLLDFDNVQIEDGVESVLDIDPTKFNWLWSVGAGFEVAFLSLDVRYGFDINGLNIGESFKKKTNMLGFTLGWRMF